MKVSEFGSDFHQVLFKKEAKQISFPLNSILFGSGRYAIIHLINYHLKRKIWNTIYIPEYFCYEVVTSIMKTGIKIKYYYDYPLSNDNETISNLRFDKKDVILRMNYFGIRKKRDNSKINIPVIEDHSHNLFSDWALNSNADWCVASLRKTLPLPEGGILWSPQNQKMNQPRVTKKHLQLSIDRYKAMKLKKEYLNCGDYKIKDEYLKIFHFTEKLFNQSKTSGISNISKTLLKQIPTSILKIKRNNYNLLESLIDYSNINILKPEEKNLPFSFILIFETKRKRNEIRNKLINNCVYPAILWPISNTKASKNVISFSEKMLSLHIDFRYSSDDVIKMSEIINSSINS